MRLRKISAVILLLAMLIPAAASCNNTTGNQNSPTSTGDNAATETQSVETAANLDEWGREIVSDDLPADLDFGQRVINILGRSDATGKKRWCIDFYASEMTGETLNDAVFKRNSAIEERLNIKFNVIEKAGSYNEFDQYASYISKAYLGGTHEYDIVGTYSLYGARLATQGYFYNIQSLEKYLDLDKVWWNQNFKEELSIGGKLYFVVGDLNITTLTRMMTIFFNKELAKSALSDVDLYSVVKEGKWTIDYLGELLKNTYNDTNGNGKVDSLDFFGLTTTSPSEAYDGLSASMEIKLIDRKDDGTFSVTTDTEALINRVQKATDLYYSTRNAAWFDSIDNNLKKFSADECLFTMYTLDKSGEEYLRKMEHDYGVLPLPKYDESQEMYRTTPQDAFNLISMMGDVTDPDTVAAVLELMCAETYKSVTPLYYEEALKYRYMRDDDSGIMLDYLRNGLTFDFATINTLSLGDTGWFLRNICYNNKSSAPNVASSFLKGMSKIYEKSLATFLEKYDKLS